MKKISVTNSTQGNAFEKEGEDEVCNGIPEKRLEYVADATGTVVHESC
jgi:hypothetical protein